MRATYGNGTRRTRGIMSKYIEFVFRDGSVSGKTRIWEILSISSGCGLGLIKWNGSWRQYTLHPYEGTMWNHQCLAEVSEFLIGENEIHKEIRKG